MKKKELEIIPDHETSLKLLNKDLGAVDGGDAGGVAEDWEYTDTLLEKHKNKNNTIPAEFVLNFIEHESTSDCDYNTYINNDGKKYKKDIELRIRLLQNKGNLVHLLGDNVSRNENFDNGKYKYYALAEKRSPYRILYFFGNNEIVVVLGYTKHTEKLPEEIKIKCRKVWDDYFKIDKHNNKTYNK